MRKIISLSLFISLLTAFGLAGCGVKGPLQAPPEEKSAMKSKSAKKEKKEHKPFILDGLLR